MTTGNRNARLSEDSPARPAIGSEELARSAQSHDRVLGLGCAGKRRGGREIHCAERCALHAPRATKLERRSGDSEERGARTISLSAVEQRLAPLLLRFELPQAADDLAQTLTGFAAARETRAFRIGAAPIFNARDGIRQAIVQNPLEIAMKRGGDLFVQAVQLQLCSGVELFPSGIAGVAEQVVERLGIRLGRIGCCHGPVCCHCTRGMLYWGSHDRHHFAR